MAAQASSPNSRLMAVGAVVLLLGVVLVLLILRGTVGQDDPAPEVAAAAEAAEAADGPERPGDADLVADGEQSTARVPLPLELDDGYEAVTVRADFIRGAGALPGAGDRAALYAVAAAGDEDAPQPADDAGERVLYDVEVLGVIGPRPAANDGALTFVLAVPEAEVPALLPVARDHELWLTILPSNGAGEEDGQ